MYSFALSASTAPSLSPSAAREQWRPPLEVLGFRKFPQILSRFCFLGTPPSSASAISGAACSWWNGLPLSRRAMATAGGARVYKFPKSSVDSASSAPASCVVFDSDHLRCLIARGAMDCSKSSATTVASAGLPDDPLLEILSRVPFKSLCRCKCVSKAWCDLISDPLNRKKLPQTLEGFFFSVSSFVDNSDSDDGDGEGISSDGGSDNSDSDDGDNEDSSSGGGDKNSDSDDGDGEGSNTDGGSDDSQGANGDGEDRSTDGDDDYSDSDDDSDSDDGDGEDDNSDGGKVCVHFIDMLGGTPRRVDHCFPFLTELPGIVSISILDGCNGLLLFRCIQGSGESLSESYIVSNPATEQWVVVHDPEKKWPSLAYLVFDPAASSHFHLVQMAAGMIPLYIYSSKSAVWSPVVRSGCGGLCVAPGLGIAYANGMLFAVLFDEDQIAVMDLEGNTRKIIPVPFQEGDEFRPYYGYVGQSQGRLHLIYLSGLGHVEISTKQQSNELFIWVLEDYDKEEWVLKDTVSLLKLVGKITDQTMNHFKVAAIHPDQNLVFISYHFNRELISYNMDSKEVCHLCTLGTGCRSITPYVPYFREL